MVKKRSVRDLHLWEQHRQAITPLHKKHREIISAPSPLPNSQIKKQRKNTQLKSDEINIDISSSLDNTPIRKHMRVKSVCIEARLDLHGFTRQEAFSTLQRFILGAQQRQYDWILVITGKGEPHNPHTLRNLLPIWLEQLPQVTGYAPAKQRDGGNGAYYIRIRKSPL